MSNKLFQWIKSNLDIHAGEGARVGMMFTYIFLVINCLMILKPVAQSLFLDAFGAAHLPHAFISVAVFAALTVGLYSRWLRHVDFLRMISRTLQGIIFSLLIFWVALLTGVFRQGMLFIFYIWVTIFGLVVVSQFWILANTVFNPREAKRLFSVLGTGAIAGGIFGGYLTNLVAGAVGSVNLLLVCIAILLVCIDLIKRLNTHIKQDEHLVRLRQKEQTTIETIGSLKQIARAHSGHLAFLAAIIGISVIVAKLVEYQYSEAVATNIADPDRMTAFFGFWLSNINILSLLIQLTVTRRLVGRVGVGLSLLFLPLTIIIGSAILLIFPVLWAAVLLKVGDGSLKNSLNKAALELIVLPIPAQIKQQSKTIIDVFVDSAATGIGGFLLLALTLPPGRSVARIAITTALLVGVWIYLVFRLRNAYLQSFRQLLAPEKSFPGREPATPVKRTILRDIEDILAGSDPPAIIHTLKTIRTIPGLAIPKGLKALIHHPDTQVQLEALKSLSSHPMADFTCEVRVLIDEKAQKVNQEVLSEAMHYLLRKSTDYKSLLETYFINNDPRISGAALLSAARESRRNPRLRKQLDIQNRVETLVHSIPAIKNPDSASAIKRLSALVIGAANIPALSPYLYIFLNDSDLSVASVAVRAAGESRDHGFIPTLIRKLKVPDLRESCIEALGHFGPDMVELLDSHLQNPLLDHKIRVTIPAVMRGLGSQSAVDKLTANLSQRNPDIRYAVIRALNQLRMHHPELKFHEPAVVHGVVREVKDYLNLLRALYLQINLTGVDRTPDKGVPDQMTDISIQDDVCAERQALAAEIERKLSHNMERIFRLLGLKYPAEDMYSIYQGIRSGKTDLRANAIEFLDNLLEMDLKQAVIPIIESTMIDSLVERTVERLDLKIPSERDAFEMILPEADPDLQLAALRIIAKIGGPKYTALTAELMGCSDERVREAAGRILKTMGYLSPTEVISTPRQ